MAVKKRKVSHRGSKQKGDDYEREVAEYLNGKLFGRQVVRRRLLSGGGRADSSSDLENTKPFHMELKRTERLQIHEALNQAIMGSVNTKGIPVVVSRSSRTQTEDSLVVMRLKDFVKVAGHHIVEENGEDVG